MNEFGLIARFFARSAGHAGARVILGIGDDCALLAPRAGHTLAISTDMLVAGRHFFDDVDAPALGWKALAVNLSDLAAMGAAPVAFTLALALPAVDEAWLDGFSGGLFECASRFGCALIGGDTTRGPLNICITILGDVVEGTALRRDGALPGDDVWISGTPGRAALALRRLRRGDDVAPSLRAALERPVPRVALGRALVGLAHAAVDVSDGLAQDIGHVLEASRCGATIDVAALPVADELAALPAADRQQLVLAGGDDYELCFTAAPTQRAAIVTAGSAAGVRVTRIGAIVPGSGVALANAAVERTALHGFDHFA